MRPIRLEMAAFGPYAERQIVDFRRLGGNPLLLLWGPTGAGKTMLLDAMCFALFGECSGEARPRDSVRSHLASPSLRTQVIFDFAVGNEVYRVRRAPEWQRPKTRGAGYVTEKAEAVLWRRTGLEDDALEGSVLAAKPTQVTEEVERLLGFTSRQFRQVVVLPQGEFQRFLQAGSKEREAILETLFQTAAYRRIQEILQARARTAEEEWRSKTNEINLVLSQAGLSSPDQMEARIRDLEARLQDAAQRLAAARDVQQAAQQAWHQGREIENRFQELRLAGEEYDRLQAQRPAFQNRSRELELARKAAPLVVREQDLERRNDELNAARERAAQAQNELTRAAELRRRTAERLAEETARQPEREQAQRRLQELEALRERVAQLDEAHRLLAAAQREHQKQLAKQAELDQLAERCELADQERRRAAEAVRQRRSDYEAAIQKAQALEESWYEGQAAILAQRLVPGEPCPVCGATVHPAPAQAPPHLPTEADVKQARSDRQQAETAWLKAVENERRAAEKLEQLRREFAARQLEYTQVLEQAQSRIKECEAVVRERAAGIPDDLRDPTRLASALEEAGRLVERLNADFANAQTAAAFANEQFAAAEAQAKAASDALRQAEAALQDSRQLFEQALAEAGFASVADYRSARRSESEIRLLEGDLRRFEQELAAAAKRLERARNQTEGLRRPDLAQLEAGLKKAEEEVDKALTAHLELERDLRQARDHSRRLAELAQELAGLEQRQRLVSRLAQVAMGSNRFRINFQRFVQVTLLDRVLAAASERLRRMSKGRYHLQRAAAPHDRRETGGLDLEVLDSYTGQARRVSTLSGGESFMASLALALGLSDVVQSHAGGLRLESIFVDEGFGSLDAEALESALAVLRDLQQGGRLVGVISHVAEMREQIPARLEVTPGRRGSAVRMVIP